MEDGGRGIADRVEIVPEAVFEVLVGRVDEPWRKAGDGSAGALLFVSGVAAREGLTLAEVILTLSAAR